MQKGRIALVLLWLAVTSMGQNCAAPTPATDLIDTGKVSLVRRGGNREHCFTVNVNYNIPITGRSPDIAISTSRITGYNPVNGFDYSVSAARRALTNSIGITVQIAEDTRWASMEVSYLVSSNQNFVAGSLIANLAVLTSCTSDFSDPVTSVETYVPLFRINSSLNYRVSAFISGFRTLDNSFSLRTLSSALDKIDGRVVIQIQSNAAPGQQYVYITYFVLPATPINNIDYSITTPNTPFTYEVQGLSSVSQSGAIEYAQFTICNRNQQCPQNQVIVNGRCECAQGFIRVSGTCWQQCLPNGYINQQRQCVCVPGFRLLPSGACVENNAPNRCNNPNQVQLPNGQCGCRQGFFRTNQNSCQAFCPLPNQTWNGRTCDCLPGFTRTRQNQCIPSVTCRQNQILQGGICVCQNGFSKNQFNNCVPQIVCQANEINIGGNCQCQNGFFRNMNGVCVANCGQNQQYNPATGVCDCVFGFIRVGPACINQCGVNAELKNDGRCGCIRGFGLINNICRTCPGGSQVSGNNCVCQGNTILRTTGEPACTPCPTNSVARNNECVCNPGLQFNGDRTACIPTASNCPANGSVGPNGRCICNPGFVLSGDGRTCMSMCPPNARFDVLRGCVCQQNYEWSNQGGGCVLKNTCPPNSNSGNGGVCICNQGFRWNPQGNGCVPCPADSTPAPQGNCFCNSGFQWSPDGLSCDRSNGGISCPPNSTPSLGRCNCNSGFQWAQDGRTCVPSINCPQNAFVGPQGNCVCNNGLYLDANTCKQIPTCPANSLWDQSRLQCVCQRSGQNLIGNVCKPCPTNQFWNLKECVCNAGLFRISGSCRACDPASTYNGTDCNCNLGYFGNRDSCKPCHTSCGKCTGPESNQCVTCADISLQFANGYCSKNSPCQAGYYLNGDSCSKCSDYCIECVSQLECGACASGFQIDLTVIDGAGYSACKPTCGDGKKVDIEKCDDGNKKNGDGCSIDCTIQDGWSCAGGTSVKPSLCTQNIPTRTTIEVKGAVNMVGKVVQGVRLSYIPKCFTDNDCVNCFKILDVKVVQANIQVLTTVNYIPNSDGQFLIEYTFGGIITSTFFKYQIQLNKNLPADFVNCFSAVDYAQQVVGTIDSATLALNDQTDELSLGDLLNPQPANNPSTPAPNNNNNNKNGAFGYSQKVLDLIFKK